VEHLPNPIPQNPLANTRKSGLDALERGAGVAGGFFHSEEGGGGGGGSGVRLDIRSPGGGGHRGRVQKMGAVLCEGGVFSRTVVAGWRCGAE